MEGKAETSAAFSTVHNLLNALGTLHSIDQRELLAPEVAKKWKRAMDQGWQACDSLCEMLEAWEDTLEDLQYNADECAVDASRTSPQD